MFEKPPFWLSIITVCYNDSKNLQLTLKSIRDQKCDFIQSIIIDGGSVDNTKEIIHSNLDVITDWISENDNSLYDAMNKGINLIHGEYVLFLNAGDVFVNDQVIKSVRLKCHNEDVLYGDTIIVNQDGTYKSNYHKTSPHHLTWKDFKLGMVVCHQAIFVKKEITVKYNLVYRYSADIDWAIRTVRQAKTTLYLDMNICKFQSGGISTQFKKKALFERWKILSHHFGFWQTLISHINIAFFRLFNSYSS